jgi:hypothetical protein
MSAMAIPAASCRFSAARIRRGLARQPRSQLAAALCIQLRLVEQPRQQAGCLGRRLLRQKNGGGGQGIQDQRRFLDRRGQPQRLAKVICGAGGFAQRCRHLTQSIVAVRLAGEIAQCAAGGQRLLEIGGARLANRPAPRRDRPTSADSGCGHRDSPILRRRPTRVQRSVGRQPYPPVDGATMLNPVSRWAMVCRSPISSARWSPSAQWRCAAA